MKKLFFILLIFLMAVHLLESSSIFCSKNVNLRLSQITEHYNTLHNKNFSLQNIKKFLYAANNKYETSFADNTFKQQKLTKTVDDLIVQTNIYHYYLIFLSIKSILIFLITGIIIKKIQACELDEVLSAKEFLLISFLAIYKQMYLFINNFFKIPFLYGICILSFVYLYFIGLYYVINVLVKQKFKAILYAILITIISLNYFFIFYNVKTITNLIIILAIVFYIPTLIKPDLLKQILKGVSATLVILIIINFISVCAKFIYTQNSKSNISGENYNIVKNSTNKNRDIYIIILDMYSGKDILKQKFNFDNHEFINNLEKENFYVFDHMYSNYNFTFAIIPSLLNFNYLDDTPFTDSSKAINNALLFQIAKYNNYKIYYLNSWYFTLKDDLINEIYNTNFSTSLDIKHMFFSNSIFKSYIAKINLFQNNNTEQFIKNTINQHCKKLVVLHLLAPHWPYIYDENGNKNPEDIEMDLEKGYLGYLKYTNKETIKLVKEIKTKSKNNAVIIITGDHGLRDDSILESHFSTFTAYYNPEQNYKNIPSSKTLLNFFIKAANYEFNTKITEKANKIIDVYHVTEYNEDKIIEKIEHGKNVTKLLKY